MRVKRLVFVLLVFSFLSFFNTYEAEAYTESDVVLLANIMWLENGHTGKTPEENRTVLLYTGSVVLNRVESGEWGGNTIEDVLYAKGQYASSTKKNLFKQNIPEYVYALAEMLLCYGSACPKEVVFQSMQPKLGKVWKVIDGEYFATGKNAKVTDDWKKRIILNVLKKPIPERILNYVKEIVHNNSGTDVNCTVRM